MRILILLILLLYSCVRPTDPGKRYIALALKPTPKTALACVATYDEFCETYSYPNGQRNRQWIQRLRQYTAKKLQAALADVRLGQPAMRKLWLYRKRSCKIKSGSVVLTFSTGKKRFYIWLDSCRLTPSGRVLPSVFRFHSGNTHPNGVK